MTLADLFTDWDTALEIIWTAIEPKAREELTARGYSEKWIEGPLNAAKDTLDSSDPVFFLDRDGLTIHYNTYAIASYADGFFDFFVSKELLKDLAAYPIWE